MKRHLNIASIFFGILFSTAISVAQEIEIQEPTDDLGNVTDAFQEHFFEGLKQKGIENYELALNALKLAERAAKQDPELEAAVYFEVAKNLTKLKRYDEAEENFDKVLERSANQLDVMEALYDLYYVQRDYQKAIPLVQKLIQRDPDYKEDLANLYARTEQFEKALELLDELDNSWGESNYRDAVRRSIYKKTGNTTGEITNLEQRIKGNPKSERDYLNLIYLYSEQGDIEKAFSTAQELLKNQPKSHLAHLALYKFYLDKGNTTEAFQSMNIVFGSNRVDQESKFRVLGDFLNYVSLHPEYENELSKVLDLFAEGDNGKIFQQLGDYYLAKNDKVTALRLFERGVSKDEDNFNLLKQTLLLQIDVNKFEEAAQLSSNALEIFPAQPLLYLLNGVANNELENPDMAIESLDTGIDFLFEDPKMERDFYHQLERSYALKGDQKKAAEYAQKASQIKESN